MDLLRAIFLDPFAQMIAAPDLLAQTIWEGIVTFAQYRQFLGNFRPTA
jgi:branched-chain amino acid transport system permease protein